MDRRTPGKAATNRARALRRRLTQSESRLWKELRRHRLAYHWRKQHPLDGYFLDFYCDEARLCVEVDGSGHETWNRAHDIERDRRLEELGILTLRFTNTQIALELAECVEKVSLECGKRAGQFPRPHREAEDARWRTENREID